MDSGRKRLVGYGLAFGLILAAGWPILTDRGRDTAPTLFPQAPGAAERPAAEPPSLAAEGKEHTVGAADDAPYVDEAEALHIMRITKGWELRAYLRRGLHKPLPPSRAIVERLLALMQRDPDEGLRTLVRLHLVAMPTRFLPQLAALLSDADPALRWQGLTILKTWRQGERTFTLPSMAALIDDPAPGIRERVFELLAWGSPYDQALLNRLGTLIAEQWSPQALAKAGYRNRNDLGAARALVRMEDPAFDTFLALLESAGPDQQCVLYAALRYASRDRIERALPAIRGSLGQEDAQVCLAAIRPLCALGEGARPALPELIVLLEGPSEVVARQALPIIGSMGPAARIAIPSVVALIEHPNQPLAEAASHTFARISDGRDTHARAVLVARVLEEASDEAAKALAAFGEAGLQDALAIIATDDSNAQYAALWTVARLGPKAASAVPLLIPLIEQEEDRMLRERAIGTAGYIGPQAAAAIPAIMKALASRELPLAASSAAGTLPCLGDRAREALRQGLRSKDEVLRRQSAIVLQSFHGTSQFALEELAALLADRDEAIRVAAIRAIASSIHHPMVEGTSYASHQDKALLARLRQIFTDLLKDENPQVRGTAEYGLGSVKVLQSRLGR